MALIGWSNDLSVGIAEIDVQHKKLVALINQLHDAMLAGKGKEATAPVLKELGRYVGTHFSCEEKYMQQFKYPRFAEHKAQHAALTAKAQDFVAKFESGQAALSMDLMNFLREWLTGHIKITDRAYSDCFRTNGLK